MATKEDVLQKVTDYCTEKQYTLNDDFRSQYSEKYAANYAEADVNDEAVLKDIKFHLDTAFSAASKTAKAEADTWKTKEAEYLKQIEALKPKGTKPVEKKEVELPEDVKKELGELTKFREERQKQEKRANVLKLAQKDVREDLYDDLEGVLNIMHLDYTKDEKDLANQLNESFTALYKGKIGDIRPASPTHNNIKDEEYLKSVKKVKI